MTTNAEFTAAFLEAMGWQEEIVGDEDLCLEYPACLYAFADRRVLALVPEALEMREQLSPRDSLDETLRTLFDLSQIRVQRETVLGLYAPYPVIGEPLPPVTDGGALSRLLLAMPDEDRLRGEVTLQDDLTACIAGENGELLAAAGAVCQGRLADISVAVHPGARGQGLGARVCAALIRRVQEQKRLALYRVEWDNLPSVRLAKRLGLSTGFVMEGARLFFPEE